MIPAGTGYKAYQAIRIQKLVAEPMGDEDNDLTELEAAADEAESLGAERQGSGPTVGDRVAALNESSEQGSLIAIDESDAGNDSDSV